MSRKGPTAASRPRTAAADGRERRSRETRARIRTAAGELFVRQGIDSTTVEDVAAAAGIAKATFYLHFSRKEDLVLEYAELRLRHAAEQLPGLLLRDSALDAIDEMVRVVLKGRDWHPDLVRAILLELEASTHRLHTHDLRQLLLPLIELGVARGELRGDIPAATQATFVADAIYNAMRNWGMEEAGDDLDRELDYAVTLAFDAIRGRGGGDTVS
jgi:AcrR family transcriptional regulator